MVAKKKYRTFSDQAGLYGIDVATIERTDYERYVGLWANREREIIRLANIARTGVATAFGELDKAWFYAVCESRDEAIAAFEQYQVSRAAQQAGSEI